MPGHKHTVALKHTKKRLTSSCQNPWENIPEIQPRRQRTVSGVIYWTCFLLGTKMGRVCCS